MPSVNKVILIGHLGKDPEMRYSQDGAAIANVSIATSESWKDKSGNKQEHTEWHALAFFGKLAEIAGEYLKKGSLIYVEGNLRTRKWEKEGQDHYATAINVREMKMLGGKPSSGEAHAKESQPASGDDTGEDDERIPF